MPDLFPLPPETTTKTTLSDGGSAYKGKDEMGAEDSRESFQGTPETVEKVEEEEAEIHELEKDIYSLMFVSTTWSTAFWVAVSVFVIQLSILILVFLDQTKQEDDEDTTKFYPNKFNAPLTENSITVKMAQYLAMLIALVTQDDAISTIGLVTVRYDPAITQIHEGATRLKWVICNTLRFFEGIFTVFISFIFIVQSTDVLNMFMNFAAIAFVSELDNQFFVFASHGFIPYFGKEIAAVSDVRFEHSRMGLQWIKRVCFVVLLGILVAGLAIVDSHQWYYVYDASCSELQINFGEQSLLLSSQLNLVGTRRDTSLFAPDILENDPPTLIYSYFSSNYIRSFTQNKRYEYYERGLEGDPTAGKFYYCEEDEAWFFTIPAMAENIPNATKESEGCEEGWLMQSPKTKAISLEDVPMDGWNVWTGVVETTSLDVTCNECARKTDCGLGNGECTYDYDKGGDFCECNVDREGPQCEVELPLCQNLVWVNLGETSSDFSYYSSNYTLLEGRAYNRPIYELSSDAEVIFYSGTRWLDTFWNISRLDAILKNSRERPDALHAYWHVDRRENVQYFTDPIDSLYPTGINWNEVRRSASTGVGPLYGASRRIKSKFECYNLQSKPEKSYCGKYGSFNRTLGRCECIYAHGGFHCEYAPDDPYVLQETLKYLDRWNDYMTSNTTSFDPDWTAYGYANEFWAHYDNYWTLACDLAWYVDWKEVVGCDSRREL